MIRKPLGRGLSALLDDTSAESAAASALVMVALDRIAPAPFQPRRHFDEERLQELARAIQSQGVIEPLVVRRIPGGADGMPNYELIAGERRLRAARRAALDAVPAVIRELDDRAALEMSLVENLAREELGAIDEARALARLHAEFGLSHDQVAERIAKSRPYVSNLIRLLELAPPVLEMVERGQLSAGQARPLLGLASGDAQLAAARQIVEGGLSARGAEQIASLRRKRRGATARAAADPNLTAMVENMQRALRRKVRVIRRRGKTPGRIELEYYDDNDLSALAALLMGASTPRPAAFHIPSA